MGDTLPAVRAPVSRSRSPPPARPRSPRILTPPVATSCPRPAATPANCRPALATGLPAMPPTWPRSASPRPAGSSAWPLPRWAAPPVHLATP